MSLQKKYFYPFQDLKKTNYTVEIWQETTDIIVAEEISGSLNPFKIEYPNAEIFEPVKGSGCELNLLSTSDRKFFSLYTANMLEYQIRFYKSGVLVWCGYLDSELYSEPFNKTTNYTVSFTGSDGFALLERLNYLASDGSKYGGLMLQWDIIKNILNKLNLPYKNIFVGISTTSADFTIGATETIFHKTYSNNQNWYNEDGDSETSRKVLEEILKPYSAFIIQDNANIYITDVNTIATATTTSFKKYSNTFNYISTDAINLNLGDLSAIKFAASNQQMNVVSGFNKQVVKYSPYIEPIILKLDAENDFNTESFSSIVANATYGVWPYQWNEKTFDNSNTFNKHNLGLFASYTGLQGDNINESDSYLKLTKYAVNDAIPANLSYTTKAVLPLFIPSNSKLKISCKAFCRTVDDLNGETTTDSIYQIKLRCRLKIGDKQYYRTQNFLEGWIAANDSRSLSLDFEQQEIYTKSSIQLTRNTKLDNTWIDLKKLGTNGSSTALELKTFDYLIPLNTGFSGGLMTFEIYDWDIKAPYNAQQAQNHEATKNSVKDIRIKDLEISIVDSKNNEYPDSDVEYIGFMNQNYKNEGEEITLFQGTSKIDTPIEKGSLMGFNTNYYYLKNWIRQDKTDNIENLLLRSIVSNYTNKRIELTATTNQLNSILGCLKYSNYLSGKNLMIVGMLQDFADASTSVTLQEVIIDNLEINKSW